MDVRVKVFNKSGFVDDECIDDFEFRVSRFEVFRVGLWGVSWMARKGLADWGVSWMAKNGLGERDRDRDCDRGELNDFRDLDEDRERDLENLFERLE